MAKCFLVIMIVAPVLCWADAPWDLDVAVSGLPPVVDSGVEYEVVVTLANRGSEIWDPEMGFALALHWFAEDGEVLAWEGPRTKLPHEVRPGSEVEVEARFRAPDAVGSAYAQWDLVLENRFWMSQKDPTPHSGVEVTVVRQHEFTLLSAHTPRWPRAGSMIETELVLENTGALRWAPGSEFGVAAHWRRAGGTETRWEGPRTRFPRVVQSGETVHLAARAEVPEEPGRWIVQWDVVHEGVCWFSQRQDAEVSQAVVIVVPACADGWPFFAVTILVILAAVGVRRRWWSVGGFECDLALVWLVAGPLVCSRAVLEVSPIGIVSDAVLLLALAGGVSLIGCRQRPWVAWVVGSGLVMLAIVDRVYLRFFNDLPSFAMLSAGSQGERIGASVASLIDPGDLVLFAGAGLAGLIAVVSTRSDQRRLRTRRRWLGASVIFVLAVGFIAGQSRQTELKQVFRKSYVAERMGMYSAHVLDVAGWLRSKVLEQTLSDDDFLSLLSWFRQSGPSRAGVGPHFAAAQGMNLVMIQAESLQSFVIGLEVGGEEVTPTLNRWAEHGLWMRRVTDQSGHGRSSDAELLTQTSLLPLSGGAAAFASAGNRFVSLAGAFENLGYATMSAVPFDRTFWNRQTTHRAYGYSSNLFAEDFDEGEVIGWGLNDRDFLLQAGSRLNRLASPFCAWLITLSLHHPFEGFPDHLQELDVGMWEATPVGEYLHTMRYLDSALAEFEEELAATDLVDNTVIALWGDHDAGFLWRPEVAELMGVDSSSVGWYRSQRVPVIIKAPELLGLKGALDVPAGHVDVAPTLAALFGIDPAVYAWMGRNLLGDPGDEPVVGEYACWMDRTSLFIQDDGTLHGGSCLDPATLAEKEQSNCSEAFDRAARRTSVAQQVLGFDLQQRITAELQSHERRSDGGK